jgi:hypothetical protein
MARTELEPDWLPTVQQAMRPVMEQTVNELAADARSLARQTTYGEGRGGHYADLIEGHTTRSPGGLVTGWVDAHKHTSAWLEDGTVNMPAEQVLRLTVQRSGLPYQDRPRRNRRARRGSRYRRASR